MLFVSDINDGTCSENCPATCSPDDIVCPGGVDSMGCPMAEFCAPRKGTKKLKLPYLCYYRLLLIIGCQSENNSLCLFIW